MPRYESIVTVTTKLRVRVDAESADEAFDVLEAGYIGEETTLDELTDIEYPRKIAE